MRGDFLSAEVSCSGLKYRLALKWRRFSPGVLVLAMAGAVGPDAVRSGIPDARAGLDKQDGQAQETTEFPDFYN
ncbi:hypothetical protein [Alcaligenes phenolicus]|uniref:hypothetical protein n=1 Tax=Alcaligenes phenolicus TaxID=232846 RepID=UPI002C8FB2DB|nr:hypothetical protein [Alcaligenes phenolicus]HRO20750.1 hypothetical protein [Alcaligenes phenolicus]HRP13582.1 hypothetical protein [Alcaligenes phenolicus]